MIQRTNNGYELICDECGYSVTGMDTFDEAVEYKKEDGWKSMRQDGEWKDVCQDCQ